MFRTLIIFTIVAFARCTNPKPVENDSSLKTAREVAAVKKGKIKFDHLSYDYGTITSGEKVTHNFTFKNAGDSSLKITMAQASCGCTVPEFPKKPISPGSDGIIKVVFDSNNKSGSQEAVITITSDGEPAKSFLHLTGNIKVPKNMDHQ